MSSAAAAETTGESSPRPSRWAAEEQPPIKPNPKGAASQQFQTTALVFRVGTGNARNTTVSERSPAIRGATEEECIKKRQEFIDSYINKKQRVQKPKAAAAAFEFCNRGCSCQPGSSSSAAAEPRPTRAAAPTNFTEPLLRDSVPRQPRAGPGRGHRCAHAQRARTRAHAHIPCPALHSHALTFCCPSLRARQVRAGAIARRADL